MKHFKNFPRIDYDEQTLTNIFRRGRIRPIVEEKTQLLYQYQISSEERPDVTAYNYFGEHDSLWTLFYANDVLDPLYDWYIPFREMDKVIKQKYNTKEPLAARKPLGKIQNVRTVGNVLTYKRRTTPLKLQEILESQYGDIRRVIEVIGENEQDISVKINSPFTVDFVDETLEVFTDTALYYDNNNLEIDYETFLRLPANERNRLSFYDYEILVNESKRFIDMPDRNYVTQMQQELDVLFVDENDEDEDF